MDLNKWKEASMYIRNIERLEKNLQKIKENGLVDISAGDYNIILNRDLHEEINDKINCYLKEQIKKYTELLEKV